MEELLELLKKQEERLTKLEELLAGQKNVLNIDDVCRMTGLSKSHIYKRTMDRSIPHYKQAKHLYFDRMEIEQWMKNNCVKTSDSIEREAMSYVVRKRA